MRLDKYLSDLGVAARKELKQIIRAGRVSVSGNVIRQPEFHLSGDEVVEMDGKLLSYARFRYFMMDKPSGILTATEDRNQKTVLDLLPEELKRLGLFPAGRLDKDTTGLLLLTNDGEYAHRVISPKHEVNKLYYAVTEGVADEEDAEAFRRGIVLADGTECLPAELKITGTNICYVTVREGKYHQVKRMLASRGKPVIALRRLTIGSLELPEGLGQGNICELSQTEKDLVFCKNSQKEE